MNGITIRRGGVLKIVLLALFAGIWDSFLVFLVCQGLATPNPPLMGHFPIGHIAVGIGITYYVIASAFNKTGCRHFSAGVELFPACSFGLGNESQRGKSLPVRELAGNRGRITYSVMHVDAANKERRLLSYLAESDQAHFIAQTIGDAVGPSVVPDLEGKAGLLYLGFS